MITEQYKDKVYFSKLLCTDCPNIYKDICEILDANNVAHETLSLTGLLVSRLYASTICK